jgi:hypothetical protein
MKARRNRTSIRKRRRGVVAVAQYAGGVISACSALGVAILKKRHLQRGG